MKRRALGFALLAHGLAHSALPAWVGADAWTWPLHLMWSAAIVGLVTAAFGAWRVPPFHRRWASIAMFSLVVSGLLLTDIVRRMAGGGALAVVGFALDIILIVQIRCALHLVAAGASSESSVAHPLRRRIGWTLAGLVVFYVAAAVVLRPIVVQWGSTAEERAQTLFGDELIPRARYRLDHAITIHAPADSVWPWLVQLGQTRGGFYSLSWLERAFGVDIRNANVIRPEWQTLRAGDSVFATQPGYLGLGRLGWRVGAVDPGRAFILDKWGAFILMPIDSTTTRFIVRTRGEGGASAASLVFGAVNVFAFEPAHFIMQRAMMQGVRDRAEGRTQ